MEGIEHPLNIFGRQDVTAGGSWLASPSTSRSKDFRVVEEDEIEGSLESNIVPSTKNVVVVTRKGGGGGGGRGGGRVRAFPANGGSGSGSGSKSHGSSSCNRRLLNSHFYQNVAASIYLFFLY
ncbi:hypothetical protein V2J09_006948 [Rumex salicifolius]